MNVVEAYQEAMCKVKEVTVAKLMTNCKPILGQEINLNIYNFVRNAMSRLVD